jgi:hypothetical protein
MLSSSTIGPFPQLEGSFVQVPNTVSANAIALAHNKDWANAVEILQEAELSPTNVDSLFLKQAVQGIALLNLCQYHLASHAFDRRGNDPVLVAGDPANVRRLAALLTALHTLAETLRAGVLTSVDATVAKVTNELLSFADIADSRVLGSAVERAAAIDALADVATHARVAGILTLARGASSLSLSTVATELGWPASADVTDFVTSLGGYVLCLSFFHLLHHQISFHTAHTHARKTPPSRAPLPQFDFRRLCHFFPREDGRVAHPAAPTLSRSRRRRCSQ